MCSPLRMPLDQYNQLIAGALGELNDPGLKLYINV